MSQASLPRFLTRKGVPLWRDAVVLKWVAQILSAVLVVGFLAFFISNVLKAAEARGLGLGYGFLDDSAGFPVAESVIPYDPSRSFGYALLVGLLNPLTISLVGSVHATFLGLAASRARGAREPECPAELGQVVRDDRARNRGDGESTSSRQPESNAGCRDTFA